MAREAANILHDEIHASAPILAMPSWSIIVALRKHSQNNVNIESQATYSQMCIADSSQERDIDHAVCHRGSVLRREVLNEGGVQSVEFLQCRHSQHDQFRLALPRLWGVVGITKVALDFVASVEDLDLRQKHCGLDM